MLEGKSIHETVVIQDKNDRVYDRSGSGCGCGIFSATSQLVGAYGNENLMHGWLMDLFALLQDAVTIGIKQLAQVFHLSA